MTKRIFGGTFAVSLIAILAAIALVLGAVYTQSFAQYTAQLEEEAQLLTLTLQNDGVNGLSYLDGYKNRITYIAQDGTVIYDNKANPFEMDNHAQREEILAARENGSGSAARYSSTLSQVTIYCAKMLSDGTIIRVAGAQDTVFGSVIGMWWEILLAILFAAIVSAGLAKLIAKQVVKPINAIDLKNPDIREGYGEIAPLLHRIKDQNSEIKRQMQELSRSREEFSLITENMSEGFIIVDKATNVLSHNTAALNILGAADLRENKSVLALNRSESFRTAVESALSGEHSERQLEIGSAAYQLLANPVMSGGEVSGVVMIILDITDKEQRERLRREFTSNVSHELKTPLTSIYGISDMLVGGIVKPEDIAGFAQNIRDESGRLITLIDDIIKLSQLDEDNFIDKRENVNLTEIARTAAQRLKQPAAKYGISITVSGDEAQLMGISSVLEEMIYNLLDNAVKYSKPQGSAEINIKNGEKEITVTVSDNGIGIPADSIGRVFERFYRADKSHSRRIGGTGLGLSIVKHGTLLHGGTVGIASAEGKGTRVTLTLPKAEITEN